MALFGNCPPNLRSIQKFLKAAEDHDEKDIVVAYWCRLYAVQTGLKVNEKSKNSSSFLFSIMDWLEKIKSGQADNEAITSEVVAQAYIENYALKLFLMADREDRDGHFNKNVVKAFYTAGLIYDVVNIFGDNTDEVAHQKKYAKWKATYIHNCLKNGITPVAGPLAMEGAEDFEQQENNTLNNDASNFYGTEATNSEDNNTMSTAPYPVGGLFSNQGFPPMSLTPPVPGSHAPPSTPNGSSQHSPSSSSSAMPYVMPQKMGGDIALRPEDFHKAQKLCKWAGSALQYEDVPTAVENLQKALLLLTTGKEE